MSFCSGVIFSFRHHSFIATVLFLPLLSTISDGNHHHLTYISWANTCKQSYLYVLKILTVKTLLIINSCLVILPMIKNSVPSQYMSPRTMEFYPLLIHCLEDPVLRWQSINMAPEPSAGTIIYSSFIYSVLRLGMLTDTAKCTTYQFIGIE